MSARNRTAAAVVDGYRRTVATVARIAPYAKAVAGAAAGLSTALAQAGLDGDVSAAEWYGALLAAAITAGGVWAVPNRATRSGTAADPDPAP